MGPTHPADLSRTLFVATDLDHFEASEPSPYADDVTISGRAYRRLDPRYYAWLRRQTATAKRAFDAGRLSAAAFDRVRAAFNAVHAWAVRVFGEAALVAAARRFDPARYEPPHPDDESSGCGARRPPSPPRAPSAFAFPTDGNWPVTEPVAADAVAKVDAIRDEALAAGWTLPRLYQNRAHLRYPYGGEFGVVCFLDRDVAITSVAADAITLARPRGSPSRFLNPDVEHPWVRRAAAARA